MKYKILLLIKRKLTHKEKVVIKNLKKKKIKIEINSNADNLENYSYILSDYDSKYPKYNCIINLIKFILNLEDFQTGGLRNPPHLQKKRNQNLESNISKKLTFLKDIFHGLDAIIFSSGPSAKNYDKNIIKKLQDSHIIISNKYIINNLIKDQIQVDIAHFSSYGADLKTYRNELNLENILSLGTYHHARQENNLFDLNFILGDDTNHEKSYKNIKEFENFGYLRLIPNGIVQKNNKITFKACHSMMEIILPISELCGIKNMFTYGWDGPDKNGEYIHSDDSKGVPWEKWNEFEHMDSIVRMFKKEGISLFKCDYESPINLDYQNIEDLLIDYNIFKVNYSIF